jgi:hypothetical protein
MWRCESSAEKFAGGRLASCVKVVTKAVWRSLRL